jgi:hypothetical protein
VSDNASRDLTELPATIQDAIEVTLSLGYQYLWVDKYCINQSNPRKLQDQVSMMDKIYATAALTIVATAGTDSSYALPGVSTKARFRYPTMELNGTTWTAASLDFAEPVRKSA